MTTIQLNPYSPFIPALKATSLFIGKDVGRPALCKVLFESEGDFIRMVATDSFRLARAEVKLHEPAEALTFALDRQAVSLITRIFANKTNLPSAIALDGDDVTVIGERISLTVKDVGVEYPNYKHLLPRSEDLRGAQGAFDPEYFADIGRAFDTFLGRSHLPFRARGSAHGEGHLEAHLFEATHNDATLTAILMPVRMP